jgi:hypothetical protein
MYEPMRGPQIKLLLARWAEFELDAVTETDAHKLIS